MDLFFTDSLYNTKVFIVSIILTIIFFILLLTRKIYKKKLTVSNLSIYSSLFLLLITIASLLVVNFFGKFTYVLFIAATITVIYSEISFLLGKYFFPNFVGENISKENISAILNNQIQLIKKRVSSKGISIGFTDEAFKYLTEKGFDPLFGARPLKRLLQDEVLNPLSEVILDIGENIEDKLIFSKDKYGLVIANKNLRVLRS